MLDEDGVTTTVGVCLWELPPACANPEIGAMAPNPIRMSEMLRYAIDITDSSFES
jgi:hypothetical protein